jgi:hypothetical protein
MKALKNTMGLLSKGESRVASTAVWCDLTASTSAVCSTERAKVFNGNSDSSQALAAAIYLVTAGRGLWHRVRVSSHDAFVNVSLSVGYSCFAISTF